MTWKDELIYACVKSLITEREICSRQLFRHSVPVGYYLTSEGVLKKFDPEVIPFDPVLRNAHQQNIVTNKISEQNAKESSESNETKDIDLPAEQQEWKTPKKTTAQHAKNNATMLSIKNTSNRCEILQETEEQENAKEKEGHSTKEIKTTVEVNTQKQTKGEE